MATPWYRKISDGLARTRDNLAGNLNVLLGRGPEVDEGFWEGLEESLLSADMGVTAVMRIVDDLRDQASRRAVPDAAGVLALLVDEIAGQLETGKPDFLDDGPVTVLVVGVNGTGKTTTIAKLARSARQSGREVLLGSGDTFRAAAIEQLDTWAQRIGVPVVAKQRGADAAAVVFDTVEKAKHEGYDLVLVDTAGRLHTSVDLMAELQKVKRVAERESVAPVRTLLVMDATTGQNGLAQARTFDDALGVDGVALTKLDGTAKGGIAVAVTSELDIPILRVGVGEGMDDLEPFDSQDFARALVGQA